MYHLAEKKLLLLAASVMGFSSVALGAYVQHATGLKLSPVSEESVQTALHYQQWHAVALLALAMGNQTFWHRVAGGLMVLGVACFSGSIYLSVLGGCADCLRIAPFGGTALILGWLALGMAVFPRKLFHP